MSLLAYKVLHILGVLLAFYALGGLTLHYMNGGSQESNRSSKFTAATHGLGLVVILVSGFGLLHKAGYGWPLWAVAKIGIWLLIGAMIALVRRMPEQAKVFWFLIPLLGATAAWLALFKPF